jgi:hypothetical protein
VLLHVASTPAGAAVTVSVIFFLIFAMSFAFGPVPEGGRRFSAEWTRAWLKTSIPRIVVAGVFAGLVLVAALSFGKSNSQAAVTCERGVSALTGQAVTGDRISNAVSSLNGMIDAADRGDAALARTIWLTGDTHNLTHDIDAPLRKVSEDSARTLCLKVVALEDAMAGKLFLEDVAAKTAAVVEALEDSQRLIQ